jgi:hypothetical protein
MKKMRSLINGLAASGIALAMVSTLAAQTPLQGSATVVRVKGHARYTSGNGEWKPLNFGDVLKPGTIVQTDMAKGSYVDLAISEGNAAVPTPAGFAPSGGGAAAPGYGGPSYKPAADQNVVRVAENSVLGIDKLTAMQTGADVVTETQLDLKAGHIFGSVKKMTAASRYEVKLPNGVAGIRGTTYELWASGSGKVNGGSLVISLVASTGLPDTHALSGLESFDAQSNVKGPLPEPDRLFMEGVEAEMHAALGAGAGGSLIGGLNQGSGRKGGPVDAAGVPLTVNSSAGGNVLPADAATVLSHSSGDNPVAFVPDHNLGRGTTNAPIPIPPPHP